MPSPVGALLNYRLSYVVQRPYQWRWTTPLALLFFLTATIVLVLINVPLAAYDLVTEVTFTPNATLPRLPLSNIIPSSLGHTTAATSFAPQTLTVGDTLRPNGSVYDYSLVQAYKDFDVFSPVFSLAYYNNPTSISCDITNMTIVGSQTPSFESLSGTIFVTCWYPTTYILSFTWRSSAMPFVDAISKPNPDVRYTGWSNLYIDPSNAWFEWTFNETEAIAPHSTAIDVDTNTTSPITSFQVTARPCCDCEGDAEGDSTWTTGRFSLDYPPCDSKPARFMGIDAWVTYNSTTGGNYKPNSTNFFNDNSTAIGMDIPSFEGLNTMLQNLFQGMYHVVRLDLGIARPNQIFTSAEMYNESISSLDIPDFCGLEESEVEYVCIANQLRMNATEIASQWTSALQDVVRVPVMAYTRTIPHVKPMGPAFVAVFVATSTMLSVLWTAFSIIAGTLSRRADERNAENDDLRASVLLMQQAMRKHGILLDTNGSTESIDSESWKTTNMEEIGLERRPLYSSRADSDV